MRLHIASATAPRRWRRRRIARIGLAALLVVAAPFVGRTDPDVVSSGRAPVDADLAADSEPAAGDLRRSPDHHRFRVVPIPLADPAVAELLKPGDLVDLVGTADPTSPAGPPIVARAARVRDTPAGRGGNRTILVEVPESDAARLAATAAGTPLAVLVYG
ncbi:hypothetical protein [Rhodococcus sp. IEGM 1408]|uniref:hypothetical protein n=1 Tax=Rhodococcus sp. IEGM 1408 TaxID=3082220 RepID=UPI002955974B|nr:hypothetical protein [Rhodococcus sp. IEGM 1408]MDV8001119.1 hypothetical protein [Rhodococcus sp. IEGM 1408]